MAITTESVQPEVLHEWFDVPSLDARERRVLEARHEQRKTLKEIGADIGVSASRIDQIYNKARRKIRGFQFIGPRRPHLNSSGFNHNSVLPALLLRRDHRDDQGRFIGYIWDESVLREVSLKTLLDTSGCGPVAVRALLEYRCAVFGQSTAALDDQMRLFKTCYSRKHASSYSVGFYGHERDVTEQEEEEWQRLLA